MRFSSDERIVSPNQKNALRDSRGCALILLHAAHRAPRRSLAAQAVERALQLDAEGFERLLVCVCGDVDGRGETDDGAREWPGNLEPVPAPETPEALGHDREGKNGAARLLGEQERAGLGDAAGPARAVHGEAGRAPRADEPRHLDERPDAAPRRRAARRAVAEALDEARDVFAVKALRGHHDDATASEVVGRQKNLLMPESHHGRATAPGLLPVLPPLDAEARRRAERAYQEVEDQSGGADGEALAEAVAGEVCVTVNARDALVQRLLCCRG